MTAEEAANNSFLVYASAEDRDGRYFHKTLDEIDNISFVRDRGGRRDIRYPDAGQDDQTEGSYQSDEVEAANEKASNSQTELGLESEWDLRPQLATRPENAHDQNKAVASGRMDPDSLDSDEDDDGVRELQCLALKQPGLRRQS
jgi:hypothetical protein